MKEIQEYFDSLTSERADRSRQTGVYQFYLMLGYQAESGTDTGYRGLEDIVADICAIPSVTVVTIMVSNEKISESEYVAGLKIKFIPSLPGQIRSPEDAKSSILRLIRKTKGVRKLFKVSSGFEKTTV